MDNYKKIVKKIVFLFLIALAVLVVGCGNNTKKDSEDSKKQAENEKSISSVVLKLSYPMPATGFQGTTYEFFAKAVKEESGGEVEVQTFPAGALVGDPEVLDAVAKGNVDIGHFMVAYVTPTIKELTPFEIPGVYPGDKFKEMEKATHSVVEQIFEKYGIKYLGGLSVGTMTICATDKVGKPIKSPKDMEGLAVRTPGKWGGEAIKIWGGSPVTVPLGDLPVALERKTIDVAYTGWVINSAFKLYESAPYVTFTNLQEMFQGLIMSKKAWEKLNKKQQDAINRATIRWQNYGLENLEKMKQEYEKVLKEEGVTTYYLTESENSEFKKATKLLMEEVRKICGKDGEKLIQAFETVN